MPYEVRGNAFHIHRYRGKAMSEFGRFDGEVTTKWSQHPGDDRNMELLEDFAFIDNKAKRWSARRIV